MRKHPTQCFYLYNWSSYMKLFVTFCLVFFSDPVVHWNPLKNCHIFYLNFWHLFRAQSLSTSGIGIRAEPLYCDCLWVLIIICWALKTLVVLVIVLVVMSRMLFLFRGLRLAKQRPKEKHFHLIFVAFDRTRNQSHSVLSSPLPFTLAFACSLLSHSLRTA